MRTSPIVTTSGPVIGDDSGGVVSFKGIPFARAERFKRAAAPAPWRDPLYCHGFGPVAPQGNSGTLGAEEDCLNLNIWAPARVDQLLPVLFWIHGGAFISGAGSDYDGGFLAAHGPAVIVTINYRLGPLGFLQLDTLGREFEAANNLAMTDVLAALDWVRDNIAGFGGSPDQITLSGQSAGAAMVTALMTLPQARGKFRRAIAFSVPGRRIAPAAQAMEVTNGFLAELDLRQEQAARMLRLPVGQLLAAAEAIGPKIAARLPAGTLFGPVLDGEVIVEDPLDAVRRGATRDRELWLGSCRDEMEMFLRSTPPAAMIAATEAQIRRDFGDAGWEDLLACYRATAAAGEDPRQALLSDAMWHRPLAGLACSQASAGGRVWLSRFDHRPNLMPFTTLGPTHGADNACLWAHIPAFVARPVLGRQGGPMTLADIEVAARLQASVLGFAAGAVPDHGPGWEVFDGTTRCTSIFQSPFQVVHRPDMQRDEIWLTMTKRSCLPGSTPLTPAA
jgi:para-nitrobenzyl esterase